MPNYEMPNLIVYAVIYKKISFKILNTAYPIQFDIKYQIQHFIQFANKLNLVKLQNAEFDI